MPHLWEVDHSYYCDPTNYHSNECYTEFKNWDAFLRDNGDANLNYNLVFRWDWQEGRDYDLPDFNGDPYYRNGRLRIFWMGQRKGLYRSSMIEVCRADEDAVRAFLMPRWEHLRALWAPLSDPPAP